MIRVKGLHKAYGDATVLNDLSFDIFDGELTVIIGSSGSGKTTLFRCLALREKWDAGSYMQDGVDLLKLNPLARWRARLNWAFLQEKPLLNPRTTALRNILASRYKFIPLWRKLIGKPGIDEHVHAMDYLEKVGLLEQAERKAELLSGGEKQRVAIAKAMVQGAKVIYADEPVSGLDPHAGEQVMKDLKQLTASDQISIVCIMHQVELAERYADRILGLANGEIVLDVRGRRLTLAEKNRVLQ